MDESVQNKSIVQNHSETPGTVRQNSATGCSRRSLIQGFAGITAAAPLAKFGLVQAQENSGQYGRYISIDGNRVYIEERGSGIPIVIAAGGQNPLETLRPLAENLAQKYRVITWDRSNLGRSDVAFSGARDLDLWSDQLAGLIGELGLRPAYIVGASSASRVAYTTALRYPDHTRGLFTFLVTGGGNISERLAERYYNVYARMAEEEGMAAVAASPFWAQRIAENPDNRARILSMDPVEFAVIMRRWGMAFRSSDVMIGISEGECDRIKQNGTPSAIVQGCNNESAHRRDRSELFAELTGATLIPATENYCEEAITGPAYEQLLERPEFPGMPAFRGYELGTEIPGFIDSFIQTTEAGYAQRGLGRNAFSFAQQADSTADTPAN